MSLIDGDESFPYPTTISRSEFQEFNDHNIDDFLYEHHRFSSIDSLIRELEELSHGLNKELLDLVNNEYSGFIELGKSINGGLELINSIKVDLNNFRNDLVSANETLKHSVDAVDTGLQKRRYLTKFKLLLNLSILVNDQITSFESLLQFNCSSLKSMVSLYLSILKQFEFIKEELPDNTFIKHLNTRVSSIKLELRSFLDDRLMTLNQNRNEKKVEIFQLQTIYDVLGARSEFLSILKDKKI
ncbi:uncharacterized protein PRCAT00002216001 [Priceomyces carsonii]|uniref:uncharacterized protein n=1 Tax=Priceomyces carsonii TaxID=28549 RepID=UPI002EDB7881|nr:unnamed protein product [Priceomyces carsonii]